MDFTPYWDLKPTNAIHADSPGIYTSEKSINSSTIDKDYLKCDFIDGSVLNGLRQPTLFSFVSDNPPGNKTFCEPDTIPYKKNKNESVLNITTIHLDDDIHEVNFNG